MCSWLSKLLLFFSPREFSLPVNTKAEYVWHKQVNKLMLYGAAALSRTGVPVTGCSVVGLSRDGAETMLFRLHHEITWIKYILFIFKSSSLHSSWGVRSLSLRHPSVTLLTTYLLLVPHTLLLKLRHRLTNKNHKTKTKTKHNDNKKAKGRMPSTPPDMLFSVFCVVGGPGLPTSLSLVGNVQQGGIRMKTRSWNEEDVFIFL